jgi:hypothetical protein
LPESKDYKVSVVHFGKGVRNKLHTHDSDQILIVTSGKVLWQTNMKTEVESGTLFCFRLRKTLAWGTEDSDFSHKYILKKRPKNNSG